MWTSLRLTPKVKVHAQLSTKDVPFDVAEISCTSTKVHALHLVIIRCGYKHILTSNFADGKSIPCIPTLSIPCSNRDHSESPGRFYDERQKWWQSKWNSLESNHPPVNTCYFTKCTYCCCSALSGTTAGTTFSLMLTVHTLHQLQGRCLT